MTVEAYLFGYFIGILILGAMFAGLGYWVADQKGRSTTEGAVLGFLFGPLGVLIVALLPAQLPPPRRAARPVTSSSSSRPKASSWDDDDEPATITTPNTEVDVDMDVMDALGIKPEKKPTTNEEWLKSLRIPD
jgi:hypothetical protein